MFTWCLEKLPHLAVQRFPIMLTSNHSQLWKMFGIEMTKDASYAAGPLTVSTNQRINPLRGENCAGDIPALKAIKYLF